MPGAPADVAVLVAPGRQSVQNPRLLDWQGKRPLKINWFSVSRDILIVAVLGTFGTLAVTMVAGGLTDRSQLITAFVMLSAGFAISGSLAGADRFKQLPLVAVGAWAVRLVDGLIRQSEQIASITVGILFMLVAMLVGGAISLAIVRPGAASEPPAQDPPA
jgi:hypothetical protein